MSNNQNEKSKEGTFADSISKIYSPLNNNPKFKEHFKEDNFKILLNPKNGKIAALIEVEKGSLTVKTVDNSGKKSVDQDVVGWDALMETTIEIFSDIGAGKLTSSDITKKVLTRKIKVKNPKLLSKLTEMGALLRS